MDLRLVSRSQLILVGKKGSDTKSRNGPSGASHFWCLTPFSTAHSGSCPGRRKNRAFYRGFLSSASTKTLRRFVGIGQLSDHPRSAYCLLDAFGQSASRLGFGSQLVRGSRQESIAPTRRDRPIVFQRCGAEFVVVRIVTFQKHQSTGMVDHVPRITTAGSDSPTTARRLWCGPIPLS